MWSESLQTVKRILPILWEAAPRWTILAAVFLVLEITFSILTLYLVKNLVDVITGALTAAGGEVGPLNDVLSHVLIFALATIAFLLARAMSGLAREAQGMQVADHVDSMIHSSALAADLAFYESPRYFDTLQRARQSGSQRPALVTQNLLLLTKNLALIAAVSILLFSINWILIPILLLAIIPTLFVRLYFTRLHYEWQKKRTALERRAGYLDWLITSDIHAKELRLNQLGNYLRNSYSEIRKRIRNEAFGIARRRTVVESIAGIAAAAVFFGALLFLAIKTANGTNTVGELVLFLLVFQRAQSLGQDVIAQVSKFYEDHLYIGLLFEFLNITPSIYRPDDPCEAPSENTSPHLVVRDLSFRYPGTREVVLDKVSLEVRPGQLVALVGANGSGKTSLIKILTRLYEPTSGSVCVDGIEAKEIELNQYRQIFSVIFQDYSRYADTVRKNIMFGDIGIEPHSAAIQKAARRAGADQFIGKLRSGYDTLLGRIFEGGQEISIGQWQKVALSRALLSDSGIIILDEPTSALDPTAEFELFRELRERIGKQSALVISHRLSTARMADYIYVLDNGKVAEHGTHEELLSNRSFYYKSFSQQAVHYR